MTIKGGRWQAVKYDRLGQSFVTWKGLRLYLDEFMRQTVEALPNVHGVLGTSYFSAYAIELGQSGERAKVYYLYW